RVDVLASYVHAVFVAQQVFEQDLERERQSRDLFRGQGGEAPVVVGAGTHLERGAGVRTAGHVGISSEKTSSILSQLSVRSMKPPPRQRWRSYSPANCPGVTARCGSAKRTESAPRVSTVA